MQTPRLKTANKVAPPYNINNFPTSFVQKFGEEIVYLAATKDTMSIEGNEWEHIFANCIGAEWHPSNVGLDDVRLGACCWSAKTVMSFSKNFGQQSTVRLISGRNSPTYSYGVNNFTDADPNEIGELVLGIWNERVALIREVFKLSRTVVLVKKSDYSEYLVFEVDTVLYDPTQYDFKWNNHNNLEGYSKQSKAHKFTWQPHGSQFTIIEQIPPERMHLRVQLPKKLDKAAVLKTLNYDPSWITKLS